MWDSRQVTRLLKCFGVVDVKSTSPLNLGCTVLTKHIPTREFHQSIHCCTMKAQRTQLSVPLLHSQVNGEPDFSALPSSPILHKDYFLFTKKLPKIIRQRALRTPALTTWSLTSTSENTTLLRLPIKML